jgi:hypothetical protein
MKLRAAGENHPLRVAELQSALDLRKQTLEARRCVKEKETKDSGINRVISSKSGSLNPLVSGQSSHISSSASHAKKEHFLSTSVNVQACRQKCIAASSITMNRVRLLQWQFVLERDKKIHLARCEQVKLQMENMFQLIEHKVKIISELRLKMAVHQKWEKSIKSLSSTAPALQSLLRTCNEMQNQLRKIVNIITSAAEVIDFRSAAKIHDLGMFQVTILEHCYSLTRLLLWFSMVRSFVCHFKRI